MCWSAATACRPAARIGLTTNVKNAGGTFDTASSFGFDRSTEAAISADTIAAPSPGGAASQAPVGAAVTKTFLLIDGINGGSTDSQHMGWFEIGSVQLGAGIGVALGAANQLGVTGNPTFTEIFVTPLGGLSTSLLGDLTAGKLIESVKIEGVTGAGDVVYDLRLGDVLVSSYSVSGAGAGAPSTSLALSYERIGLGTNVISPGGPVVPGSSFGFDRSTQASIDPATIPLPGAGIHTFTVKNDGLVTLTTSDLTVPTGFIVVEGLSASIAPGASDTFSVRLDPTAIGVKGGDISFNTNVAGKNPFNFTVTGTVTAPDVTVLSGGTSIDNGDLTPSGATSAAGYGHFRASLTFTVRNDGNEVLTTAGLKIDGAGQIAVTEGLSGTIAPGASDTFTVTLLGNTANSQTGIVSFATNDADEDPFRFAIALNWVPSIVSAGAHMSVEGDGGFGTATLGGTGLTRIFTVFNDGAQPLVTSGLTLPSGFSLVEGLSASIAPGSSDTFTVRLDATTGGTKSGDISFAHNSFLADPTFSLPITGSVVGSRVTVRGNGASIAGGDMTPRAADATDFGRVLLGTDVNHDFTVRNDGLGAALTIADLVLPAGYSLVEGLSASIAPGTEDTFTVKLDATALGTRTGDISFKTNDAAASAFNFRITAMVTDAAPEVTVLGDGYSALIPDSLFGASLSWAISERVTISLGSTSPTIANGTSQHGFDDGGATFTVRNDGGSMLTLSGLAVTGSALRVSEGLPIALAPGESDSFEISLAPGVAQASGTVSFVTNDSDESLFSFDVEITRDASFTPSGSVFSPTFRIGLRFDPHEIRNRTLDSLVGSPGNSTGEPIANGDTTPDPADGTDFGIVLQGAAPVTHVFGVRNAGGGLSDLRTLNLVLPSGFSLVEGLSESLLVPESYLGDGVTDTFAVRLDTTTPGTKSGTVSFDTNDPSQGTITFWITGTVVATQPAVTVLGNGVPIVDGTAVPSLPQDTYFGRVELGADAVVRTFTVRNDGGSALTTADLTVPDGFAVVEGLSASLAPGASDSFTVRLDTTIAGTRSGDISFTTNDPDHGVFDFTIMGTVAGGPAPSVSVLGLGVAIADGDATPGPSDNTDFGSAVRAAAAVSHVFVVTNDGGMPLATGGLTVPAGFTVVEGLSATIAPGASDTFTVRLDTTSSGIKAGDISFTSDSPGRPGFNFAITGTVLGRDAQDLNAQIRAYNQQSQAGSGAGTHYTIDLVAGETYVETSQLDAIKLKGSDSLTIDGHGATLDGIGAFHGLVVASGSVTIENLTIQNMLAKGGDGYSGYSGGSSGSGGGGGGLGGGLFVATPAKVWLSDVDFVHNAAVGGNSILGKAFSDFGAGGGVSTDGSGGGGHQQQELGEKYSRVNGGPGGFGGGGGGGGYSEKTFGGSGGSGGFGGGGGTVGAGPGKIFADTRAARGLGGFGGGAGGIWSDQSGFTQGGGGLGAGGDIFVQEGAQLTIGSALLSGGTVQGGAANGSAYGSGIFLHGNQVVTLGAGLNAGQTTRIDDVIADMTGSHDSSGQTGAGAVIVGGPGAAGTPGIGTVVLNAANTYTGTTTIKSGVLEIGAAGSAGSGAISFIGDAVTLRLDATFANGSTFANTLADLSAGDQIDLRGLPFVSGASATVSLSVLTVVSGSITVKFNLGSLQAPGFTVASDGAGGTLVTALPFPQSLAAANAGLYAGGPASAGASLPAEVAASSAATFAFAEAPASAASPSLAAAGTGAILSFHVAVDMTTIALASGAMTEGTPTQITLTAAGSSAILSGTFSYAGADIFGTVTGYQGFVGDTPVATVSGLALDAHVVQLALQSGQQQGLLLLALAGDDTIDGSGFADVLLGYTGNDQVNGGDGDDYLAGGSGDDSLDGGTGGDTAIFVGAAGEYVVSRIGASVVVTDTVAGRDGIDTLSNLELLSFSDGTIALGNAAVSLAAQSATKAEGNGGTTAFTFSVTRTGDISVAHYVAWAVSGSGANPAGPSDFAGGALQSDTLGFAAGETSRTITVQVAADSVAEPDESFLVTLSGPSPGLTIGTATATGTIQNDDSAAVVAAYGDAYIVHQGQALAIAASTGVLLNDQSATTASLLGGVGHGSLQLAGNGGFGYTPAGGFFGIDSFTYRAGNGGSSADAEAAIYVVPVNVGATTTLNLLALTADEQIAATYAAFFGRAADFAGHAFWVGEFVRGLPVQGPAALFANIASSFGISVEAKALYPFLANPSGASDGQISAFLDSVYNNLFNRSSDPLGLAYWTGQIKATLQAGQFVGSILVNIMGGAQDTAAGKDITTLMGKVAVSLDYVQEQEARDTVWAGASDIAAATSLLQDVTADPSSVLIGVRNAEDLIASHA